MTADETHRAVAAIQEPPSTSLSDVARDCYLAARHTIDTWSPRPCPPDWTPERGDPTTIVRFR